MTLPTFLPPMTPSVGSSQKPDVNLRRADFGDGYSQAAPAGLNHIREVASLRWDVLTRAEKDQLVAFLKERGGYQSFTYQLPTEATARRWTCDDWRVTALPASLFAVEATLREAHQ